jgi:hypothetical protein
MGGVTGTTKTGARHTASDPLPASPLSVTQGKDLTNIGIRFGNTGLSQDAWINGARSAPKDSPWHAQYNALVTLSGGQTHNAALAAVLDRYFAFVSLSDPKATASDRQSVQADWADQLMTGLKALDPFTGVETLTAKGLSALASNPEIAKTPWGKALANAAQNVATIGAFQDGIREGVWEGGKSLVTGIAGLVGKGAQYLGDSTILGRGGDAMRGLTGKMPDWLEAAVPSSQRGELSDAAIGKAASGAFNYLSTHTPEQAGADIGAAIGKAWDGLSADHAKTAAQGPVAEARWWGKISGRVGFEVAATFVPVAGVASKLSKGAKVAEAGADLARGADALGDAGRVAGKVDDLGKIATKVPLAGDVLKAEVLATAGKSIAAAKAIRAMSPAAAREFLLGVDNFAARENILRTIVSDPKLLDVATKADTAIFYSGRVTLEKGVVTARQWAESLGSGKTILEHTSGGRWLDNVKAYDDLISRPVADEVWTTLSSRYADSVSGKVVVVKGNMRPDAVLHAELKILEAAQRSGKITDLKIIDLQTVIEKLAK